MPTIASRVSTDCEVLEENWQNQPHTILFRGITKEVDSAFITIRCSVNFSVFVESIFGAHNGHPDTALIGYKLLFQRLDDIDTPIETIDTAVPPPQGFHDWDCRVNGFRELSAGKRYKFFGQTVGRDNCSPLAASIKLDAAPPYPWKSREDMSLAERFLIAKQYR